MLEHTNENSFGLSTEEIRKKITVNDRNKQYETDIMVKLFKKN